MLSLPVHGPFDGILHSAGIHDDDLIGKKTAAGFERVLAAKVQGTVQSRSCDP